MKNIFVVLFLFLSANALSAQEDCSCSDTFAWIQEKLKLNYAGYYDKVTPERKEEFDAHTRTFTATIDTITTIEVCHSTLLEWAEWFEDGHIQLSFESPEQAPEDIRARFSNWPTRQLSMETAKSLLDRWSDRHPVEGIWQSDGSPYQVAILRPEDAGPDNKQYQAYILKADSIWWMPGQVKMELDEGESNSFAVNYYMRDHSLREETAQVTESGLLRVSNLGGWYQIYPLEAKASIQEDNSMYALTKYDEETLVLTIPTFNEFYRQEMRELIKENSDWMEQTPNWIIDCRGNGGGSDMTYFPLRPYIATGEVLLDGMQTRATVDNANKYEELSQDKSFGWLTRRWAKARARKLRKNAGEFIGGDKCIYRDKYKSRPMPKRVAVLIDGGCASSCEQFTLFVNQSKKVTVMGQASAGILDYGNLIGMSAPCQPFTLYWATTRSCRVDQGRGIDNIGIPPNVTISEEEEDWIEVAADHLKAGNQ